MFRRCDCSTLAGEIARCVRSMLPEWREQGKSSPETRLAGRDGGESAGEGTKDRAATVEALRYQPIMGEFVLVVMGGEIMSEKAIDNDGFETTEPRSQNRRISLRARISSSRWLLAIAILGFSFLTAYLGGWAARYLRGSEQPTIAIDELAVANSDLDMGEVWEAKNFVCRLPIHNHSSRTIEIRKFVTSCGCTAVEPSSISILPGETAMVNVNIDLTHRLAGEYDLDRRFVELSIRPITRRSRRDDLAWQLHGIVFSRVTLDAQTVAFGEQPIHGQTSAKRRLLATVHVPCQQLDVSMNPLIGTANVKRLEDVPNRFEITIAVNPSLQPGNFQTEAKISVIGLNGERALAFTLPIAGTMQTEVRLLPARVLLEPKPIGEMAEAVVTLQVPSGVKVAVDHIEIDDPGLRIELATIASIPAGHAYRIRQQVTREGEQNSIARFIIRQDDQKLVALSVIVCSHGEKGKKAVENRIERIQP